MIFKENRFIHLTQAELDERNRKQIQPKAVETPGGVKEEVVQKPIQEGFQMTPGGVKPIPGGIADPNLKDPSVPSPEHLARRAAVAAKEARLKEGVTPKVEEPIPEGFQMTPGGIKPIPGGIADPNAPKEITPAVEPTTVTPTPEEPLVTVGVGEKGTTTAFGVPFDQLDDRQKEIELGFKVARQRSEFDIYSDEELKFLIGSQLPEEIPPGEEPGAVAEDILKRREGELTTREEKLRKRREKLVAGEEERLSAEFGREKGLIEEGGERRREVAQAGFSFSGFGRSTENVERQDLIQRDVNEQIRIADLRRKSELALFEAGLKGADEATLGGMRDQIDTLRLQEDTLAMQSAQSLADANAANKVSGLDAIANMLQILPPQTAGQVDQDITELINDGYLYKINANGVPEKVLNADGSAIATGVNDSLTSELSFTAPKYDMFGNLMSPGYMFDKTSGMLEMIDPATGQSMSLGGGQGAFEASQIFQSFDDYTSQIGSGVIVKGSQYHKGFEVDIDGVIGDPIYSFTDGEVLKAQTEAESGGYGNSIVVQMEDGTSIRYAHLNNLPFEKGQTVFAGMVLGEMGNTGNVIPMGGGDGSHLHIEAKDKDGNLIALDDLNVNQVLPGGFDMSGDAGLKALAASKGYVGADEMASYINALKNGIELPDKAGTEESEKEFDQVVKLQSQYKELTKTVRVLEEGFSFAKTFDINTTSAYDDDALIFSYVKVLDPGSVVREGEYDIRKNATSIYNSLAAKYNLAFKGEGMITPDQRQQILDTMDTIYKSKREGYDKELADAVEVGEHFNLDPELYLSYMPGDWVIPEAIAEEGSEYIDSVLGGF